MTRQRLSHSSGCRLCPSTIRSANCKRYTNACAASHNSAGPASQCSRQQRSWPQHPVCSAAASKASDGSASNQTGSRWMAPEAWVSAIASDLPSVDVDSLSAYSHLLQECLVLQPSLLLQPPRQAAASLVHLERCLRASAVWLGPGMVSQALMQHSPASLAEHLSGLMQVWLDAGGMPHTFGQLWLEAPAALLARSPHSFSAHLLQLQQQLPDMPIAHLLSCSSSLAGALLSSSSAQQLGGCIHRAFGYLIIAPKITRITTRQEQSNGNRAVVAVYGQYIQPESADRDADSIRDDCTLDKAEQYHSGSVYGFRQALEACRLAGKRQINSTSGSSRTTAAATSQSWQGPYDQECSPTAAPQQLHAGNTGDDNCADSAPLLLMQLDVRPTGSGGLMPVLILPPEQRV